MKTSILVFFSLFFSLNASSTEKSTITVASKPFTESYILAEILAQTIENVGELNVQRRMGIGATGIIYESLKSKEIDIYPEYTGTISETILKNKNLKKIDDINLALNDEQLAITASLGFGNNYALAMQKKSAQQLNLLQLSDLKKNQELRVGFTHEFMKREDGYEAFTKFYDIKLSNVSGMEHSLAYQSLSENKLDLIEVYSTDAKIKKYNLWVLKDDKFFFPQYLAVFLYRKDLEIKFSKTWQAIRRIESQISEDKMIELNAKVEIDGWSFEKTAAYFLNTQENPTTGYWQSFLQATKQHLSLVFISLLLAIVLGLPLGILAARFTFLGQLILISTSLLQTIPSLALLCFLIPFFGVGYTTAVVALFLYALLPIVRNTYLGISNIDSKFKDSAFVIGLSSFQRLYLVEIPLAAPAILSGIKLSAVMNVGTATLAAFIGAGGYGAIIVTGLALNNTKIILQGAIPSAVLAVLIYFLFELIDYLVIPKGIAGRGK
ncbi:MAG: ABC transporter permease subunit [Bdellovibrio sp.]|nr:ABC transporter permease subunit [Bdellovibrio sp.]